MTAIWTRAIWTRGVMEPVPPHIYSVLVPPVYSLAFGILLLLFNDLFLLFLIRIF